LNERGDRLKEIEVYCKRALERGVNGAKAIDPCSIATAEWVRMKCQFGCPGYGMRLCCPPYAPSPDVTRKVIDAYQKAILLHRQIGESPKRREETKAFNEIIVQLEIEIFLDGHYKALSLGSGPCRLCKECDTNKPCQHGYEARPSMEACGVDVFKTARDNGFPIRVVRSPEQEQNIFGLILVD